MTKSLKHQGWASKQVGAACHGRKPCEKSLSLSKARLAFSHCIIEQVLVTLEEFIHFEAVGGVQHVLTALVYTRIMLNS